MYVTSLQTSFILVVFPSSFHNMYLIPTAFPHFSPYPCRK